MEVDLVIMDERLGRFHAKHANLKTTGTLGVLLKAKEKGIIKTVNPLLVDLKKKGIWLDNSLIEKVLKMANENSST